MTRIAVLTPYAPPVVGGISTFVAGMKRALVERGHEVCVIAGAGLGDGAMCSDLGLGRTYVKRAGAQLVSFRPEVIHCNSHSYVLRAGVNYRKGNPRARLLFSFHTTPDRARTSRLRFLLAKADSITFVSKAQQNDLRGIVRSGTDARILAPATDIPDTDPDASRTWLRSRGLAGRYPILMFAGPLEYREKVRGVTDLVRAMPEILGRYPKAKLVILGDGSLRGKVSAAAEPTNNAVSLLGFDPNPSIAFPCATLYCHISYREGLPLAVLEAMAAGSCVLASPVGGIPEVIDGSNGVLVEGGPPAIASAVVDVCSDPARRRRLAKEGLETIRRAYTWDRRVLELESLYGVS